MDTDLTQFHQTFFEESFEGLDTMEAALLHLQVGAADMEVHQYHLPCRPLHQGGQWDVRAFMR